MKRRLVALGASVALVAAGCGGGHGSGDGGGSATSLSALFATVKTTPALRHGFGYADQAYIRSAFTPGDAAFRLITAGSALFLRAGADAGTQPYTAAAALTIGTPPHEATLLAGGKTTPDGVRAALTKLGAKPGKIAGKDGLVWGAAGSTHPATGANHTVGLTGEFDRVILGTDRVIAGRFDQEVGALDGVGKTSLADDPIYGKWSGCLGNVFMATGGDQAVGAVAVGLLKPPVKGDALHEVLCVVGGDQAALQRSLQRYASVSGVQVPALHERSIELWSRVVVTRRDGYVRAEFTDRPGTAPTTVLTLAGRDELFGD